MALHLADMSDVTSPSDYSLDDLAHRVVNEVWSLPSLTQVTDAAECTVDDNYVAEEWCICGTGKSAYI